MTPHCECQLQAALMGMQPVYHYTLVEFYLHGPQCLSIVSSSTCRKWHHQQAWVIRQDGLIHARTCADADP